MPELPLIGTEYAGYRLRAVLGRGGMSVVYQAENPRLGSVIALKVLAPEVAADDVFRARFLEESRIAASLNHPNVIPVYDAGSSRGLLYIATRYVSGTDMRQMIKKRERIVPSTAVFLVGQAARALDAAHRRGLVHRDVKPGNLLIERGGDEADPDHVYLADFGITKHAMSCSGLTMTGQFLGTIDYVAPEQIRGLPVLGLADQYSLGCVLYECLTGRVPFEKDLDAAIIWAHVEDTPTMPTVLRPDLPPEIDEVFARVLAKRPDERYGSCREFVDAARCALGIPAPGPQADLSFAGTCTGSQPGASADGFSWSRLASQSGATLTSHRRAGGVAGPGEPGEPAAPQPPPRRPRRRWFPWSRWMAAATALILMAAGGGAWALATGNPGHTVRGSSMSSPSGSAKKKPPGALMRALMVTNQSPGTEGLLPPSACRQYGATSVTCTDPALGISEVTFRTYPSLTALYAAYQAQIASLNSGHFSANFSNCGLENTYGEVAWNHQFKHMRTYSVAQMISGMVTANQAEGRVFCTFTGGQEEFVWTQDDGHLLGYVTGGPHEDVWFWWVSIHHNISLGGPPMHM